MAIDTILGIGQKVNIKGKEYTLSPITIADFGEISAYIKAQRLKIFEMSNPNLTLLEKIQIKNQDASSEEIDSEMSTIAGTIFYSWLSLRHAHPELTLQKLSGLIDEENYKAINESLIMMGDVKKKGVTETEKK